MMIIETVLSQSATQIFIDYFELILLMLPLILTFKREVGR